MQNVVVFGGAGFVGSHLVEALLKQDKNITVVDDFSNGSQNNLSAVSDKIKIIKFDIVNKDWSSLMDLKPDVIFHLATHPRSFSLQDPIKNADVNVIGMINVLDFAKKKNSKLIYTSNSGICGDPQFLPVTEEHPIDCKTPYDANKLIGEHYAKIYQKIYGLYITIFRLATVYGERQIVNEELGWRPIIPNLVKKLEQNETPIINWDGEQTRDLIYVKDVADCLIKGSESNDQNGEMFLLSTNKETSVNEALRVISEVTGKNIAPTYTEKNPGDIRRMVLSYEKAKKAFGYSPRVSLKEGVTRYVNWYRSAKR
ncbi:MAG: NAD-dependent epimerase/dehydratase family protein [Nitrososphaeria archaeon]|nr:NAD-dependent epimerase/dehydratase family protein [Nitrososphaeria archaeon]NDF25191.1 NAD-dependent epimerase/dehydratase family protein [Nitrososphaerota archaeon]NDF26995.1 NAD-dependent epimerase/dehydratase family protein [Nitrosopumilaceae archaeon]NDB46685.1 NAD-dependent epimerase/dehydratase family protein [Nitrososphaeria archaeon]NDB92522.1 NAD-dependent epimerase/dehydratase family protein [Nitrososphaeria archaeon]